MIYCCEFLSCSAARVADSAAIGQDMWQQVDPVAWHDAQQNIQQEIAKMSEQGKMLVKHFKYLYIFTPKWFYRKGRHSRSSWTFRESIYHGLVEWNSSCIENIVYFKSSSIVNNKMGLGRVFQMESDFPDIPAFVAQYTSLKLIIELYKCNNHQRCIFNLIPHMLFLLVPVS